MNYIKLIATLSLLGSSNAFANNLPDCDGMGYGVTNVSGPTYALLGKSAKYRADVVWSFAFQKVYFYTSENGYVGYDKASIDRNAYKHISFDNIGNQEVWAQVRDSVDGVALNGCEYTSIRVHGKPKLTTLSKSSSTSGGVTTFDATLEVEWASFSQAKDQNKAKTITWSVKEECRVYKWGQCAYPEPDFGSYSQSSSGQNKHMTFSNTYPRTIKATIHDGVSSKTLYFFVGDQFNDGIDL